MTLEIHSPDLLHRVNAHLPAGQFHNAEDLIEKALDALEAKAPAWRAPSYEPKNLVELFAPLRGQFLEEIDALFSRNPSTARRLDLE